MTRGATGWLLVGLGLLGCGKSNPRRTTARAELSRCLAKLAPEGAEDGRALVLDVATLAAACPPAGADRVALAKAITPGISAADRMAALAGTSFRCVDAEAALAKEAPGPELRGRRLRAYAERCGAKRYGLATVAAGPYVSEEVYVAGRLAEELARLVDVARDRRLSDDVAALRARLRLLLPLPAVGVFEALPPSPETTTEVVRLPPRDRGGIILAVAPAAVAVAAWPLLELQASGRWDTARALDAWPLPGKGIEGGAGAPEEWQAALAGDIARAREDVMGDDPRFRVVPAPLVVIASGDVSMLRVAAAIAAGEPPRGSSLVLTLARDGERVEVPVRATLQPDDQRSGPTLIIGAAAVELLEERSRVTLRRVAVTEGPVFVRELGDELGVWRKVQETRLRVKVRPETPYRVFATVMAVARRVWGDEVFYGGLAPGAGPARARAGEVAVALEGAPAKATRLEVSELRRVVPALSACLQEPGHWQLRLVAEPDGTVSTGGLMGSGDNDEIEGCVTSALKSWRLPAAAGRRTLHFGVVATALGAGGK
ncbi:MAG: hypothetical protein IT370_22040 [Deltaproteobacteria bacterium]|nr:hypothetical protein [Deltaproteobacteria bacterium]